MATVTNAQMSRWGTREYLRAHREAMEEAYDETRKGGNLERAAVLATLAQAAATAAVAHATWSG